jgi:hypothetical protein
MPPRRELKEWLLAVRIGRSVRYAILEGPSDRAIVNCLLAPSKSTDVTHIGNLQVELEREETAFLGGNRARLARLSEILAERRLSNALCVIDRDFEDLYACLPKNENYVLTDFANTPAGFCDHNFVRGFLERGYGVELGNADWESFCSIFRQLFAIRYWKAANAPREKLPDATAYLSIDSNTPKVDWKGFYARVQALSSGRIKSVVLAKEANEITSMLAADCRSSLHTDDLFPVLHSFLRLKRKVSNTSKPEEIRSAFLSGMSAPRPGQERLVELSEWLLGAV